MVQIMRRLYTEDGFISPIKWPSVLHDGFFTREICIFRPENMLTFVTTGCAKRGSSSKVLKIPPNELWNKHDPSLYQNRNLEKEQEEIFAGVDPGLLEELRNQKRKRHFLCCVSFARVG